MTIKQISQKPPRWDQDNSIYFLTFCTFERKRYLHRQQIPEMIIDNIKFYSLRLKELIAYTVMPDHIHLMVNVDKVKYLSDYLRDFKKRTSKEIKNALRVDMSHIWQRGTMDHCIRVLPGNEDYINHLNHIFYNSVKHLGIIPKDFLFHNFDKVVQKGWLQKDFCATLPKFPRKFGMYE
jgi:REP element-mobilizing transposase RayT